MKCSNIQTEFGYIFDNYNNLLRYNFLRYIMPNIVEIVCIYLILYESFENCVD